MVKKKFGIIPKKLKTLCSSLSPKFCFAFYIFLTDPIVKNSNILAGIYFNFFKKMPRTSCKSLSMPNLDPSEKIGRVAIKENKIYNFSAT